MQKFTVARLYRAAIKDFVVGEIEIVSMTFDNFTTASLWAQEHNANDALPYVIRSVSSDNGQFVRLPVDVAEAAHPEQITLLAA